MARILVISPSGEVYDHDNVRWYDYANLATTSTTITTSAMPSSSIPR